MDDEQRCLVKPYVLLNNGIRMPLLGFGTYRIRGEKCVTMVTEAVKAGYRLFDTSSNYRNEAEVGLALNKCIANGIVKRKDIFISTKIGPKSMGYARARECIANSLQTMNFDYLDMVLIHWPGAAGIDHGDVTANREARKGSWRALLEVEKEGLVKCLGVSNYTIQHIRELTECTGECVSPVTANTSESATACARIEHNNTGCVNAQRAHTGDFTPSTCSNHPPAVNQVELHPMCKQIQLRIECAKVHNNIQLQAYSSLGSEKGESLRTHPQVMRISAEVGKSPAQVLLRWGVQSGFGVLSRTSKVIRLNENLGVVDWMLCEDHMRLLNTMSHDSVLHRFCWDPTEIC